MPAGWISAAAGVYGALNSGGGGSGSGGGQQMYTPTGLGYADQNWQYNQAANQGQLDQFGGGTNPNAGAGGWGGGGRMGFTDPGMGTQQRMQPQGGGNSSSYQTSTPGSGGGGGYWGPAQGPNEPGQWITDGGGGAGGGTPGTPGGYQQAPYQGGGGGGGPNNGGGLAGTVDPAFAQSYQQSQNVNYQPYLQASQQAGQQYGQLAGQANNTGMALAGQGAYDYMGQRQLNNQGQQFNQQQQGLTQGMQAAGQQVFNTGMDPQNALHDRMQSQVMDNSNVINSQYGLGSSGAGAAIAGQNVDRFNQDWQNQQLSRQEQGLGAMEGANKTASGIQGAGMAGMDSAYRVGGGLGAAGSAGMQNAMDNYSRMPGYTQQSGQVPMNAWQYAAAQPGQNASTYAGQIQGGMNPYMAQQGQAIPYMNYGSGAQNNQAHANLQNNQFQAGQQQALGNTIGNLDWSKVGNWFNGGGGGGFDAGGNLGGATTAGDYSDIRLKKNVRRIGRTPRGNPMYRWDWKTGGSDVGVLAHEVAHIPGAVKADWDGLMMVDYGRV